MNRWLPWRALLADRLGFSQVNAHAGMRESSKLVPWALALPRSRARRRRAARLVLGGSALGQGNWRAVGFTRQNEAIGVIKLPATTGSTQHLLLASNEHG